MSLDLANSCLCYTDRSIKSIEIFTAICNWTWLCIDIELFLSCCIQLCSVASVVIDILIVHPICVKSLHDTNVPFAKSSEIRCACMYHKKQTTDKECTKNITLFLTTNLSDIFKWLLVGDAVQDYHNIRPPKVLVPHGRIFRLTSCVEYIQQNISRSDFHEVSIGIFNLNEKRTISNAY